MKVLEFKKAKPFFIALACLLSLSLIYYLDERFPFITFILVYMLLVYTVADHVGGWFSYLFAGMTGLSHFQTENLIMSPDMIFNIWLLINLILGYIVIAFMVNRKNKVVEVLSMSSRTDALTKLPNRLAFLDYLERSLSYCNRWSESMSVAYIDIDGFKQVNDKLGHHVGDELLVCIGKCIKDHLRADDMGSRLGGDEFAVIFRHSHDTMLVTRLKEELDKCAVDNRFKISFSIGMVEYDGSFKASPEGILSAADELMYEVKHTTKNAIKSKIYTNSMKAFS